MNAEFFNNWTNQLRKGLLELRILNSMRNTRMYGYEIIKEFVKTKGLIINEGTIYPILYRLKHKGLVKTSVQKSTDGPPRKYYELTAQGKKTLCQMNAYWQAISKSRHRKRK